MIGMGPDIHDSSPSRRLRGTLRRVLAYALYFSGLLWLLAALRFRGRAVALMYHRVLPAHADTCSTDGIIVTPATFAMQMAFLKKHFRPLSVGQFRNAIERGRIPDRGCLVTFDDGWWDNERYALPVLEQFGVPAVVFLATGYIGGNRPFWQEELTRDLLDIRRAGLADSVFLSGFGIDMHRTQSAAQIKSSARELITRLKSSNQPALDVLRTRLALGLQSVTRATGGHGDDRFMDWEAVRRLSAHPLITIASHAHSHMPLTRLGHLEARADLLRSLGELRVNRLPETDLCAYPNGDHDAETIIATKEAGFSMAFTTMPGHVHAADDRHRIRRMNIHESVTATRPEFLCRLLGLF